MSLAQLAQPLGWIKDITSVCVWPQQNQYQYLSVLEEGSEIVEWWVGRQALSDYPLGNIHIRYMLPTTSGLQIQIKEVTLQMVKCDPMQFYFVFPNDLALNIYSWMLPHPFPQENQALPEILESVSECKQSVLENIILSPLPADPHTSTDSDSRARNFKNDPYFKKMEDEEYRPLGGSHKKGKKSKQMENRNVVPNIIRLILSYIQKKEKSQRVVEALLKRYNVGAQSSIGLKRYYLFQKLVRGKMNNYVNEDTLKELYRMRPEDYEVYPEQEQRIYNCITRTLVAQFLREDVLACILTSKRMESAKKRNHLEALRTIKAKMPALFLC